MTTQPETKTTHDASANGQAPTTPTAQPKTTAPKRTASRATRAAAKTQPSKPQSAAKPAGKATPAKPTTKAAGAKAAPAAQARDGKRFLATQIVLALGAMVKGLTAEQLKTAGMTRAEAATAISTWVHHIPADRDQWVKVLPKPDRSDWR